MVWKAPPVQLYSVNMVWIFVFHFWRTRRRCRKPVDWEQFTFSYTASAFEISTNLILLWKPGHVFIPATSCYLKTALTGGLCKYRAVGTRRLIWKAALHSDLRIHSPIGDCLLQRREAAVWPESKSSYHPNSVIMNLYVPSALEKQHVENIRGMWDHFGL